MTDTDATEVGDLYDWPNQEVVRADGSGPGRPVPPLEVAITLGLTGPGGEAIVGGGEHGGVRIVVGRDGAPVTLSLIDSVDWGDGNVHEPPDISGGFIAHVYTEPAEAIEISVTVGAETASSDAFDVIADGAPADEQFDPGEHTVAEVQEYIALNPDDAERVLAAERAGKNRSTLVGDA